MWKILSYISWISLVFSGIFFLLYGYAHTQNLKDTNFPQGDGHIAFVLDVSKSMLVRDMWWNSRLDVAKQKILNTIQESPWAEFSLSIFAWESQRILPFTRDIWLFATFLSWIGSDNLSQQWTEISLALEDALESFWDDKTGTLILLSDGAEQSVLLESQVKENLSNQELDIKVVGVGTQDWGNIIEWIDPFWRPIYKTYQWKRVISVLNDFWLKILAADLSWRYYDVWDDLEIWFWKTNLSQRDIKTFWLIIISWCFWLLFLYSSILPVFKNIHTKY